MRRQVLTAKDGDAWNFHKKGFGSDAVSYYSHSRTPPLFLDAASKKGTGSGVGLEGNRETP